MPNLSNLNKQFSAFKAAKWASYIWWVMGLGLLSPALLVFLISIDFLGLFGGMPSTDNLANPKSELASEVYSADGVMIGKYFRENRSPAKFEELSPNLIKALYATEDIRFDKHSGIDFKGTGSIFLYLAIGKKRGSSTLTQQLAKNLFATRSEAYEGTLSDVPGIRTLLVKAKEWITAIRLERSYTKKEILTMYLNTVHFGSNAFGIKTAARTFFNTTPSKLTEPQSAMLVGMLKAPSLYSPIFNPSRALRRRNTVLDQMEKYNLISEARRDSLMATPLALKYKVESHNDGIATYFRAELRKELLAFCKERQLDLFSDGLKIKTTLDSRLQLYAEQAVDKHMRYLQKKFNEYWKGKNPWTDEAGVELKDFIENAAKKSAVYREYLMAYEGNQDSTWAAMNRKVPMVVFSYDHKEGIDTFLSPLDSIRYYKHFLHAGLLSVTPYGSIKAWVGGVNYRFFKYDHVRQGRRQPGSSFKPFIYITALDKGYTPCTEMVDAPVVYKDETTGAVWSPQNSDGKFSGARLTLRTALAQSINSVAAGLILKVSPSAVVEYAKKLGIEAPLDPVPALALGSSDVSLYEMVGAYATFVNSGVHTKPYFLEAIYDKNNQLLKRFTPERREVLNEEIAYAMVYMLQGSTKVRNGTALGLHRLGKTLQGNEVGGKTGTTSNYSDGWFMGITKDLITGVWVGGDDRSIHFRTPDLGQGARMAMPIWSYYMDKAYEDPLTRIRKGPFIRPVSLSQPIDCGKALNDTLSRDSLALPYLLQGSENELEQEY